MCVLVHRWDVIASQGELQQFHCVSLDLAGWLVEQAAWRLLLLGSDLAGWPPHALPFRHDLRSN